MAHDRSGLSATTSDDAEMIAKLGYVVFAEDIFGKGIVPKNRSRDDGDDRHL